MKTILGVIICPWCYLPFIPLQEEVLLCPHCNRRVNQWDIEGGVGDVFTKD